MNEGILTQTDPGLDGITRRFGCRVTTLFGIPQHYIGKRLRAAQAMEIIEEGRRDPDVIGENSRTGKKEHWLINAAFHALGRPDLRGAQVGRMKGEDEVFWNAPGPYQYIIGHWVTFGPDGHFTLFDPYGIEIFDPWIAKEASHIPGLPDNYVIQKRLVDKRYLYRVWRT